MCDTANPKNTGTNFSLPEWLTAASDSFTLSSGVTLKSGQVFSSREEKMRLVVDLALENVRRKTGGPFAAAIFKEDELFALGLNLVEQAKCSLAHAEIVAIARGQAKLGSYDFAADSSTRFSLYASGQPCIMCFGAVWWSGVSELVYAATAADIEEIVGFQEGPVPGDWVETLRGKKPSVEVVGEVCREEAQKVLREYVDMGGVVYNPGGS